MEERHGKLDRQPRPSRQHPRHLGSIPIRILPTIPRLASPTPRTHETPVPKNEELRHRPIHRGVRTNRPRRWLHARERRNERVLHQWPPEPNLRRRGQTTNGVHVSRHQTKGHRMHARAPNDPSAPTKELHATNHTSRKRVQSRRRKRILQQLPTTPPKTLLPTTIPTTTNALERTKHAVQLLQRAKVHGQPTSPDGPRQNANAKRKLARPQPRQCRATKWPTTRRPKEHKQLVFPMRPTRTLRAKLPATTNPSQPHRLDPRRRRMGPIGDSRTPKHPTRRQSSRAEDPVGWTLSRRKDDARKPNGEQRGFSLRLIRSAWIRRTTDSNVYLSARKSMTVRTYLHSNRKRAEAVALLDSGATENFMNLDYAKWLGFTIKRLPQPRTLLNVDGTTNKAGTLQFYTDVNLRTGTVTKEMRFFLTNLGDHKIILGYPWFAAKQPKVDWARGWIDHTQLPIIIRSHDAHKAQFSPRKSSPHQNPTKDQLFIGRITFEQPTTQTNHGDPTRIPTIRKSVQRTSGTTLPRTTHMGPRHRTKTRRTTRPTRKDLLPHPIEQEELKKFVKEHLAKGYIRPSKSPYAAPFFFIKKKDGKLRPVQDYRRLNKWTIRNQYPLPLIHQLIPRVRQKSLFTKFDVRWGYNNVRIRQGDEWKAAFITNEGLYEPSVMFFGLTNSPATFQTMMNAIFAEEIRAGWLTVYMDDMLIATKDDPWLHTQYVKRVLQRLMDHDLYLKPEKCLFHQKRIEFLGVVLENNTVQMDPSKTDNVRTWAPPTTVTEVRSFLGFVGFYRYFIPNFSKIARPLLNLTKKATVWNWDEDCNRAFTTLKTLVCERPVLVQPDYTKRFILHTDASAYGVGAVLLQEGELNPSKPSKPRLHPIAYYSATFTPTERNYDIYERELLAVIKALHHWRYHLKWTRHPFLLVTDHANLTFWKAPQDLNRRTARWHGFLQDYWFEIIHAPGKTHTAADFLSRPMVEDKGQHDNKGITMIPPEAFIRATTEPQHTPPIVRRIAWAQKQHEPTMNLWAKTYKIALDKTRSQSTSGNERIAS
jgi:hypothetical protein